MKVIDDGLFEMPPPPENESGRERLTVARLFKSQSRRLVRFLAHRLQSHEDAQDASQEAFLRLWRHEQSGDLQDEATAYLFSAGRSISIDQQRWRQSRHVDQTLDIEDTAAADVPNAQAQVDETLHWRKGIEALVSCLEELPELSQQVFILTNFEGLTQAQAARRLGINARTAERHIMRAMAHCRTRLKDYL